MAPEWTKMTNLASATFGGTVVFATDGERKGGGKDREMEPDNVGTREGGCSLRADLGSLEIGPPHDTGLPFRF